MRRLYNTQCESDIISFHVVLCQLVFAAILLVKHSEMFVTLLSLKYALSVG